MNIEDTMKVTIPVCFTILGIWIGHTTAFLGIVDPYVTMVVTPVAAVLSVLVGGLVGAIQLLRKPVEEHQ